MEMETPSPSYLLMTGEEWRPVDTEKSTPALLAEKGSAAICDKNGVSLALRQDYSVEASTWRLP